VWDAIGKIFFSKHRDLFAVGLGSNLLLAHLGIVPGTPLSAFLGFFVKGFLGFIMDSGVFIIDVTLDSLKEGKKLDEFRTAATAAYAHATAQIYDETEKAKIRKQYLDIISKIGVVGDDPK
jgi:hypothetical protein